MSLEDLEKRADELLSYSLTPHLKDLIRLAWKAGHSRAAILARLHRAGATRQTLTGLACEFYLARLTSGKEV